MCLNRFFKKTPVERIKQSGLNQSQKVRIKNYLQAVLFKEFISISPSNAVKALNAIFLPEKEFKAFTAKDIVLEGVKIVRVILSHDCPQNRSTGLKRKNSNYIGYEEFPGAVIKEEKKGLLNLTPLNDGYTPPVDREVVINYIALIVAQEKQNILNEKDEIQNRHRKI